MTSFPRTISALQREHPRRSPRSWWGFLPVGLLLLWSGYFFFDSIPLYKTAYIAPPGSMPFTVYFPADDAPYFRVGETAQLRLDTLGSRSIPAQVVAVQPGSDRGIALELTTSPMTNLAAYFDQNTRILLVVEIGHSTPSALLMKIVLPHAS